MMSSQTHLHSNNLIVTQLNDKSPFVLLPPTRPREPFENSLKALIVELFYIFNVRILCSLTEFSLLSATQDSSLNEQRRKEGLKVVRRASMKSTAEHCERYQPQQERPKSHCSINLTLHIFLKKAME